MGDEANNATRLVKHGRAVSRAEERRNEVERTINRLKNSRAVATRYDKRAYVFHGTAAAVRLSLKA